MRLAATCLGLLLVACSSDGPASGDGQPLGTGGKVGTGGTTAGPEAGADTWGNFAQAFFGKYCVSCHDGTMSGITGDFRQSAQVMQHSTDIRCGVATTRIAGCEQSKWAPRQFPAGTGPKPSDAERMRLVAWIDAGLPQ